MGDPPDEAAAARGGRHVYPRDASMIVAVSNGLSRHVPRRIDAIPGGDRHDVEQAGALAAVGQSRDRTGDRVLPRTGARRGRRGRCPLPRRAGGEVPSEFGLSTECGLGRHSTEQLEQVAPTRSPNCSKPGRLRWPDRRPTAGARFVAVRKWVLLAAAIVTEVAATLSLRASQDHARLAGGWSSSATRCAFTLLTLVLREGVAGRRDLRHLGCDGHGVDRGAGGGDLPRPVHLADRGGHRR